MCFCEVDKCDVCRQWRRWSDCSYYLNTGQSGSDSHSLSSYTVSGHSWPPLAGLWMMTLYRDCVGTLVFSVKVKHHRYKRARRLTEMIVSSRKKKKKKMILRNKSKEPKLKQRKTRSEPDQTLIWFWFVLCFSSNHTVFALLCFFQSFGLINQH